MHNKFFSLLSVSLLAGTLLAAGCSPLIAYRIEMKIRDDYSAQRKVLVLAKPSRQIKNQRLNLKDYLELPNAEAYENFVYTPEKLLLSGEFKNLQDLPPDFQRPVAGANRTARNSYYFRSIDLVLVKIIDYEENFADVVDREQGEQALAQLVEIVETVVSDCANDLYGPDYDTAPFVAYLRENLPSLATKLYQYLWEMRRARRDGLSAPAETDEWLLRASRELERLGIKISGAEGDTPEKKLRAALAEFLDERLPKLLVPKRPEVKPLGGDFVRSREVRSAFLDALQKTVDKRYGSLPALLRQIDPLVPKAFGAYLPAQYFPSPANPHFNFIYSLRLPGQLIRTNGLLNLDGSVDWAFRDVDIALAGYSVWARSVILNQEAIAALKLADFGSNMATIELLYRELRRPTGELNEPLIVVLRECVKSQNLAPLVEFTEKARAETKAEPDQEPAAGGEGLLNYLRRFQPDPSRHAAPEIEVAP